MASDNGRTVSLGAKPSDVGRAQPHPRSGLVFLSGVLGYLDTWTLLVVVEVFFPLWVSASKESRIVWNTTDTSYVTSCSGFVYATRLGKVSIVWDIAMTTT
uniref:Uncharacterized protein n=1 Tax=Cannabis sativa TaxID=3483 RepID=A0A803P6B8_CANSA